MSLRHFPVIVELNTVVNPHGYQLVHKYGMEYHNNLLEQSVHKVHYPYHEDIEIQNLYNLLPN